MTRSRIALSVIFLMTLLSCDKIFLDKTTPTSMEVFDELWDGVNQRYVCFSNKEVDWDAIYTRYRRQITNDLDESQLFFILGEMLGELKDGHVSLESETKRSSGIWRDSEMNVYPWLVSLYLGKDCKSAGGLRYSTLHDGKVGYAVYSSFMDDVSDVQVMEVLDAFKDCYGLVLDLRGNTGGQGKNMMTLAKYFVSETELFYSYVRHNNVRNDLLLKGLTYRSGIKDDRKSWRKPLIVLIDNRSYSASSMFAMCVKGCEQVYLVGVKTAGGTNAPLSYELSNGWIYRIPSIKHLSRSRIDYEDGVPPDVEIHLNKEMADNDKRDSILDAACEMIVSKP